MSASAKSHEKKIGFAAVVVALAMVSRLSLAVEVDTVAGLRDALVSASDGDEIVLAASGSPYDLSTVPCMRNVGHLYAAVRVTLRGATGNPADVVLVGSTNRVLYCAVSGNTIRDITFRDGDCTANEKQIKSEPMEYNVGGGIAFGHTGKKDVSSVSNCVFKGCKALYGGAAGMYLAAQETYVRYAGDFCDCVFDGNSATTYGGAVYCGGRVRLCKFYHNASASGGAGYQCHVVENCDFVGNTASDSGGAINGIGSSVTNFTISGCNFLTNTAAKSGGAISSLRMFSTSLYVTGCTFVANRADGAGNTLGGGAVHCISNAVAGCTFVTNTAEYGGAAYGSALVGCILTNNVAAKYGGGVYSGTLSGCTIAGNSAADGGAAAYSALSACRISDNYASVYGGAAFGCSLSFCTNVMNRAETAAAATELFQSTAADCSFDEVGVVTAYAIFRSTALLRCRVRAVTGSLFHSVCAATNCLFAGGTDFYVFYTPQEGCSLANCTFADNVFKGFKNGTANRVAEVVNCLFYGNRYSGKTDAYDIGTDSSQSVREFRCCIFRTIDGTTTYAPGSGNLDYYGLEGFVPHFAGASRDAANPYALRPSSAAVSANGAVAGEVSGWMADATDLRGEGFPRLRGGRVDIGCYQCWDDPKAFVMSLR